MREVDLPCDLEVLLLLGGEDAVKEVARVLGSEGSDVGEPLEHAAHANHRRRVDRQMEVRGVARSDLLEQRVDRERRVRHGASVLSAVSMPRFSGAAANPPFGGTRTVRTANRG